MKPFRLSRIFSAFLRRPRRKARAPDWHESFEQIPSARRRRDCRIVVAWTGTQVLPIPVTIEDPDRRR